MQEKKKASLVLGILSIVLGLLFWVSLDLFWLIRTKNNLN